MIRPITLAALATTVMALPAVARADGFRPDLICQYESAGCQNIPNFRFDATHSAQGPAQITTTDWRRYAPMVDIDINKWPSAGTAPAFMQWQVAFRMYAARGYEPWTCCNTRLRAALGSPRVGSPDHTHQQKGDSGTPAGTAAPAVKKVNSNPFLGPAPTAPGLTFATR
jgi:hypothetical protein